MRIGAAALAGVLLTALLGAYLGWRNDILEALLDPQLPFAVYKPPPAPDYRQASAWALRPGPPAPGEPGVDVFFVHPTTFDGGRDWNGSIEARAPARLLARVMLPNYAAPFAMAGRVFAPRYRQASLYSSLTLFDDAIEAREFPYQDIKAAFAAFRAARGDDRPFILVGVEQGGLLAGRLLQEEIATDPTLRNRLVAAYLIETAFPANTDAAAIPPCRNANQTGCVVAWVSAPSLDFGQARRILNRSLVWNAKGSLVGLAGRAPLCVNPLLGRESDDDAPPRFNRGAANASGLEWGARPGFLARQVGAYCQDGVLRVTRPRSASLRPSGDWAARLRVPAYNLFWADLEADALGRAEAWKPAVSPKPNPSG